MSNTTSIDAVDVKIISLLQQNPLMTRTNIAKEIGLSQPSITFRFRKLLDSQKFSMAFGADIQKCDDLHFIKLELKSGTPHEIFEITQHCPYILNAMVVNGEYNLMIFMVTRDLKHVQEFIEHLIGTKGNVMHYRWDIIPKMANPWLVTRNIFANPLQDESDYCANCRLCQKYPKQEKEEQAMEDATPMALHSGELKTASVMHYN